MTKKKWKTWQQALNKLDVWVQSIEQTKELILTKYGDITQIRERALELHYLDDIGSLSDDLKPEAKKVDEMLWGLIIEAEKIGSDFVTREIGFNSLSSYHVSFLDYWKYSIHPVLMPYYGEILFQFAEENMWTNSVITKRRGKNEIIDSICWYRGKVSLDQVIQSIKSPLLPSFEDIPEQSKPGRKSEAARIDMEAIVCLLLKEQGLKHKEISDIFGIDNQQDGHGNVMNRTIGDRIRRGKELRLLYGNKENITDK